MKHLDSFVATICLTAILFFLVQQAFLGLRSSPTEIDSIAYHIPIARHIKEHGFWSVPQIEQGWGYYPAVGETLLAGLLSIDESFINLYNVFSISLVFIVSIFLGLTYGLSLTRSVVFSTAVSLLNPALRLVNNQTVDVWFQLFFLSSVFFLRTISGSRTSLFFAGLSLGFLAGTKYSGPFVVFLLLLFFLKRIRKHPVSLLVFGITPLLVVGGIWYIRNFFLTGNPFYPANISFLNLTLPGGPSNRITDWIPLKTLLTYPGGVGLFVESLIWEYSVWLVFLGYFLFRLFVLKSGMRKTLPSQVLRLVWLGVSLWVLFLLTPSWPKNMLSDLRYTLPGMSLLILSFFLFFSKRMPHLPLYATLLALLLNFPFLTHHPKVNIFVIISFVVLLNFFKNRLVLFKQTKR